MTKQRSDMNRNARRKSSRRILYSVLVCVLSFCFVSSLSAAVSGVCSNCHTMHNSQDGLSVEATGPQKALLNNDCIGCHTGSNAGSGSSYSGTPHVTDASAPVYSTTGTEGATTTLAGGSFFWVTDASGGNAVGHNVKDLASADPLAIAGAGSKPPGFGSGLASADGTTVGSDWTNNQLTCAGTYGCHGTHNTTSEVEAINGAHHSAASGSVVPGGSPTAKDSYRMLVGIAGYEDSDWEFRPTASTHNQYKGVDTPAGTDTSTISYLCAQCHGTFHQNTQSSSPWVRHPTDYDMANSSHSDYDSYNGGTGTDNTYSVIAPVASASVTAVLSVVTPATTNDDTIVTCTSCHRAHGTPYYKAMRWDYAGGIGGSCAICHTSKN